MDTTISRNGKVTPYGFACGYYEQNIKKNATLTRENGVYFVRSLNNGKHIVETFRLLSAARLFVRRLPDEIK